MATKTTEDKWNHMVFGSMYFVQGLNQALLVTTLLYYMQNVMGGDGVLDKEGAGHFLFWIGIPWGTWKLLGGPLIDRLLSRELSQRVAINRIFRWMLVATLLTAISLELLTQFQDLKLMLVFAVLTSSFMAIQDLATDTLSIYALRKKSERGTAQGLMAMMSYVGAIVGGSGAIHLMTQGWSWEMLASLSAVVLLLVGVLFPWMIFQNPVSEDEDFALEQSSFSWKQVLKTFWGVVPITALLLALTAMICQGATANVIFPWFKTDLGFSGDQIKQILLYDKVLKIPGAFLGMLLMRYMLNEKGVVLALVLKVLAYLWLGASVDYWGDAQIMYFVILSTSVADGIFLVALRSYFMEVTNKAMAATQFAVYMAVLNFGGDWTNLLGAELSKQYDSRGQLLMASVLQLVAFAPLLVLWLKRKR